MDKYIEFGEIAEFRNGLNFSKDSHGKGCLLIGVSDFKDNFSPQYDDLEEINPEGVSKDEDYLKKGDLLFVRSNGNKALVGRSLYITKEIEALYSGFCIRARLTTKKIDPLFLAYYSKTKQFKNSISHADGTNINNLNQGILSDVRIPLYSQNKQRGIASVLSTIDKKIELNNKINAELEAMAKLIYDYWFVQFDFPFDFAQGKPDANGKPYKSSGGKMVYNEALKREIPDGWLVDYLGAIESNIVTGKTPSTKKTEYFNGNVPFICIGDVRGNMHITKTDITLSELGANSQANKYIPEGAICVTCIASPGLVGFATEKSQTNQQLNTVVCSKFENQYFLYFYLKDYFRFAKAKSGNTFANMNKGDFSEIKVINPENELLIKFSTYLKPTIDKILVNSKENNKLVELRDWLLPMLMNGQVTVKDA